MATTQAQRVAALEASRAAGTAGSLSAYKSNLSKSTSTGTSTPTGSRTIGGRVYSSSGQYMGMAGSTSSGGKAPTGSLVPQTKTTQPLKTSTTTNGLKTNVTPKPQTQAYDAFGDVTGKGRVQYQGQGIKVSTGEELADFSKPLDMPKELDFYGEAARQREKVAPGTLANRNDTIAYNLRKGGVNSVEGISEYLSNQSGFKEATQQEQQNTIASIASRMGISEQPKSPYDQLTESYMNEQNKLIDEGKMQDVVKRMDHMLGEEIRPLTDQEVSQIAQETGLTPEQVRETSDSWSKNRQRFADPYQQKEEDLALEKQRGIDDANLQLERTERNIQYNIDDTIKEMERDMAGAEKVGALKGYIQSSGYVQGINNVKTDAMTVVSRLKTQIADANYDTTKYINRVNQDFGTNMDRLKKDFTDGLLNLRMAGTNEVNTLLTKYSPSEKLLSKELDRLNNEYGLKSMDLYNKYLENFKGITDAAMYESEKIQQFQTKQRELENLTISNLYANDGAALMNMSDSQIQSLADQGYISKEQVGMLRSAREGFKQQFSIKQTSSQIDWAKLGIEQQKLNNELGITDISNFVSGLSSIPNGIKGGQCVEFVNDGLEAAGLPSFSHDKDQSIENKISKINSYTPKVGSVLIRTSVTQPEYGDVVFVTGVDNGVISYKGSNKAGEEQTYTGTINANDSSIKGYFDPTKASSSSLKNAAIKGVQMANFTSDVARQSALKDIKKLADGGQTNDIQTKLKNIYKQNLGAEEMKAMTTNENTITALKDIQKDLASIPTNLLKGGLEKITQKLGKSSDPKLAALSIKMNNALDILRRGRSGAALTQFEESFYNSMFPSMSKDFELNSATILGLTNSLQQNIDSRLSNFYGDDVYSNIRGQDTTQFSGGESNTSGGRGL